MNAMCQLNFKASHATSGGAMIAPMELPATLRLLAVARSEPGNQIVTTRSCEGNAMGSASPSKPRKAAKAAKRRVNPAPRHALDQPRMPTNIMCRAPNRSTSQPATGYMPA